MFFFSGFAVTAGLGIPAPFTEGFTATVALRQTMTTDEIFAGGAFHVAVVTSERAATGAITDTGVAEIAAALVTL